jgi:hypothetical protein
MNFEAIVLTPMKPPQPASYIAGYEYPYGQIHDPEPPVPAPFPDILCLRLDYAAGHRKRD